MAELKRDGEATGGVSGDALNEKTNLVDQEALIDVQSGRCTVRQGQAGDRGRGSALALFEGAVAAINGLAGRGLQDEESAARDGEMQVAVAKDGLSLAVDAVGVARAHAAEIGFILDGFAEHGRELGLDLAIAAGRDIGDVDADGIQSLRMAEHT